MAMLALFLKQKYRLKFTFQPVPQIYLFKGHYSSLMLNLNIAHNFLIIRSHPFFQFYNQFMIIVLPKFRIFTKNHCIFPLRCTVVPMGNRRIRWITSSCKSYYTVEYLFLKSLRDPRILRGRNQLCIMKYKRNVTAMPWNCSSVDRLVKIEEICIC